MFKKLLKKWLDNRDTPTDAWMVLTFAEIDTLAKVPPYNACVQLPKVIAAKIGTTEAEVRKMRMQYRYENGLAKRS